MSELQEFIGHHGANALLSTHAVISGVWTALRHSSHISSTKGQRPNLWHRPESRWAVQGMVLQKCTHFLYVCLFTGLHFRVLPDAN